MAAEILETASRRAGTVPPERGGEAVLWQYDRGSVPPWRGRPVPLAERPPKASTPDAPC